jgi:hypothetical protein
MKKVLLAAAASASIAAMISAMTPLNAQQTAAKDQIIGSWKVLNLKATTGDRSFTLLGTRWRVMSPLPPRGFGYCSSMRREKRRQHQR